MLSGTHKQENLLLAILELRPFASILRKWGNSPVGSVERLRDLGRHMASAQDASRGGPRLHEPLSPVTTAST